VESQLLARHQSNLPYWRILDWDWNHWDIVHIPNNLHRPVSSWRIYVPRLFRDWMGRLVLGSPSFRRGCSYSHSSECALLSCYIPLSLCCMHVDPSARGIHLDIYDDLSWLPPHPSPDGDISLQALPRCLAERRSRLSLVFYCYQATEAGKPRVRYRKTNASGLLAVAEWTATSEHSESRLLHITASISNRAGATSQPRSNDTSCPPSPVCLSKCPINHHPP
jgi:hypothetical protein